MDAGLQPERTALAWRRTALAVIVGSLVAARLLTPTDGPLSLLLATAGGIGGLLLFVAVAPRRQRLDASLREHGDLRAGPGAAALAILATTASTTGTLALAAVILHAWR